MFKDSLAIELLIGLWGGFLVGFFFFVGLFVFGFFDGFLEEE